jgi:hypothetical protein
MNAYDLYEFFIEAEDLKGQAHKVKVQEAYVKEVFNPGTKGKDKKIILRLVGKQKVLSLNKTRAGQMIEITGTPDFTRWAGAEIVIRPGKQSGKDTVIIEAPTGKSPTTTVEQPKNQPAKIVTQRWRNLETGKYVDREIGDRPPGDMWAEEDEEPTGPTTGPRLQAIIEKAKEDSLVAFSELRKAAGLDSAQVQEILRECGGDYDEAFKKIATQYAEIIG